MHEEATFLTWLTFPEDLVLAVQMRNGIVDAGRKGGTAALAAPFPYWSF
jgi:hypothetical protein